MNDAVPDSSVPTNLAARDRHSRERSALMQATEGQLRLFIELAPASIAMFDREMRYVAASRRWRDEYRLSGDIVGQSHYELLPECSEHWGEVQRRALAGETLSAEVEQIVRVGGGVRWVKWEVLPWRTDSTSIGGILIGSEDITERRRADQAARVSKQALHEREERLLAILNTAADAIVTIDRRGIIQSVNPAAEGMFGYSSAEMLGQNVTLLMPSPYREQHDRHLARYLQTRQTHIIGIGREVVGRRKDGNVFPAELAVSEVDHMQIFTGIIRDISQRKELEREVLHIASLEQQRIGQDLHDTVSQELTALRIRISDLAEVLQTDPSAGPQLVSQLTRGLLRCQEELRAVMRGLLPVSVDAEGLMAALSELAERSQRDGKATCTFQCPELVSLADNLTATHLYLIAQEAVHNALKHAKPQNICISLKANGFLMMSVRDDGTGIKEENQGPVNPGGLGLRIMHNRAAIIGAVLKIERVQPAGTLVQCTLPRKHHGKTSPREASAHSDC